MKVKRKTGKGNAKLECGKAPLTARLISVELLEAPPTEQIVCVEYIPSHSKPRHVVAKILKIEGKDSIPK